MLQQLADCITEHGADLERYAYSIIHDHHAAQDLVQQAFLKSTEAIKRGAQVDNSVSWLYRCVRNLALDQVRRQRRLPSSPIDELPECLSDAPAVVAERREHMHQILRAVDSLSQNLREAFLLGEVQGLKYREIADEVGLSTAAASQRLLRARNRVRSILDGQDLPLFSPAGGLGVIGQIGTRIHSAWTRLQVKALSASHSLQTTLARVGDQLAAPAIQLLIVTAVAAGGLGASVAANGEPSVSNQAGTNVVPLAPDLSGAPEDEMRDPVTSKPRVPEARRRETSDLANEPRHGSSSSPASSEAQLADASPARTGRERSQTPKQICQQHQACDESQAEAAGGSGGGGDAATQCEAHVACDPEQAQVRIAKLLAEYGPKFRQKFGVDEFQASQAGQASDQDKPSLSDPNSPRAATSEDSDSKPVDIAADRSASPADCDQSDDCTIAGRPAIADASVSGRESPS